MDAESSGSEMPINKFIKLNDNGPSSPDQSKIDNLGKTSEISVSFSAASSTAAPSSEYNGANRFPNKFERHHSLQDLFGRNKSENKISAFQRERSNSDGAAIAPNDNPDAFPSLSNAVLQKMGLHGDVPRERLTEESLEQKFTSLSLAFTIDAATIKDRCERQRRSRDQTESNFNLEVEKLKERLALLQPMCMDFESAELLSILFAQVETLTKAASLVSIAAERYGAVQHEERLTESVQLMVNHVQALKLQRDSARRQLQYTKRVLQEPIVPPTGVPSSSQKNFTALNMKVITKRRASIDSVNLSQSEQNFKLNRRFSDLPFRASLSKNNRPSRLELGMELNKIKEIYLDEPVKEHACKETVEETVKCDKLDNFEYDLDEKIRPNSEMWKEKIIKDVVNLIRLKMSYCLEKTRQKLAKFFTKWSQNGYIHAFLNSCAILCFSVSILTLVSIFLEQDYGKRIYYWVVPWYNRKH